MASRGQPIARVPFTDGVDRDVFEDADGRQFVADDNEAKLFGYWVLIDDPAIVDGEQGG
jgi:hypothetical protein